MWPEVAAPPVRITLTGQVDIVSATTVMVSIPLSYIVEAS